MQLVEQIDLPRPIREGWGLARDWKRPFIMYISDGSNNIYECDVLQGFKVVKIHTVR